MITCLDVRFKGLVVANSANLPSSALTGTYCLDQACSVLFQYTVQGQWQLVIIAESIPYGFQDVTTRQFYRVTPNRSTVHITGLPGDVILDTSTYQLYAMDGAAATTTRPSSHSGGDPFHRDNKAESSSTIDHLLSSQDVRRNTSSATISRAKIPSWLASVMSSPSSPHNRHPQQFGAVTSAAAAPWTATGDLKGSTGPSGTCGNRILNIASAFEGGTVLSVTALPNPPPLLAGYYMDISTGTLYQWFATTGMWTIVSPQARVFVFHDILQQQFYSVDDTRSISPTGTAGPSTSPVQLVHASPGDMLVDMTTSIVYQYSHPPPQSYWIRIAQLSGATGLQGSSGPQGLSGITGASGLQGNTGASGLPGSAGITGPQGPSGIPGSVGATGASGGQGLSGSIGATGASGGLGLPGATGMAGPQGIPGATGASGGQGLQGTIGATGASGVQGLQGTIGATGASGTQGPQGVSGAIGATGLVGGTGPSGLPGLDGVSGSTGPSGAPGLDGVSGSTGPSGPPGLNGVSGSTGPSGLPGLNGVSGSTGPSGLSGLDGVSGSTGASGPPGLDGVSGSTGPSGPQGTTGSTGPSGIQGLVGTTGSTGPSGFQGAPGNTGSSGAQGLPGGTGPSGLQGLTGATGPSAQMMLWNSGGDMTGGNFLTYGAQSSVEDRTKVVLTRAGTLRNLYAYVTAPPGTGNIRTFSVRVNNQPTPLIISINDSASTGNNPTDMVPVNPFDCVSLQEQLAGTPAPAIGVVSAEFWPA